MHPVHWPFSTDLSKPKIVEELVGYNLEHQQIGDSTRESSSSPWDSVINHLK